MINILVVDDEFEILDTCVNYLTNLGHNVRGANNSKEAFKLLGEFKPDIAILDINLKERYNGLDVLKKTLELYPKVKTIMFTGLTTDIEVKEAMSIGATMTIRKPVKIDILAKAISDLYTNGRLNL
ncbi:MAG: response regulator [Candidatus Omnitrophica bacterium]|nr:response regulator [Candidatus Omnitrophota bacterium]